jgi:tRNA pseudouridine55 synthase
VHVTANRIEIVSVDADRITLEVDCSAGFYVRALAHDLGERLGVGAHLDTLRRTRTGDYTLDAAATIEAIERAPDSAATRLIPLSGILTGLPAVTLTPDDVRRAGHGQNITAGNAEFGVRNEEAGGLRTVGKPGAGPLVRLVDEAGNLVAIAERSSTPGLLHPSVVLV